MSKIDLQYEIESRVAKVVELITNSNFFPAKKIETLAIECINTLRNGGKIGFVGNGGSAAEAMHLAAEFTSKCVVNHEPLSAICLNESQAALTAIGNDYGFASIFARIVKASLVKDDILIALSTSGKSQNIINALTVAEKIGVKTYLWTGADNAFLENVTQFNVPSTSTPRIQEIHLIWGHILSEIIELHFKID